MSLAEIGGRVGRDPSTVGYWVAKHGLEANGRKRFSRRGDLDRAALTELIDRGMTLREIAAELDRSVSTARHWLGRYGLKTRRHHRNRDRALQALAEDGGRFEAECRSHGRTEFLAFADGTSRCARCNSEHVTEHRRRMKLQLIAEAGGCCALCGYARYPGALQFHHRDPADKQFAVSRRGATIALDRARAEARKCVLLCANCHAEVEAGVASLTDARARSA